MFPQSVLEIRPTILSLIIGAILMVMNPLAWGEAQVKFTNSLGMRFVTVKNRDALISVWETRVQDYQAFIDDTGKGWPQPYFEQGDEHPAVNVSWDDAVHFCQWLTNYERKQGTLKQDQEYRLPTVAEWHVAAGYDEVKGNGSIGEETLVFIWGEQWPAPQNAGNYAPRLGIDLFTYTAPVGSFAANTQGLFDMSGNVWEWTLDAYERDPDMRVLKGASWRMHEMSHLSLESSVGNVAYIRLPVYGFRVVLD